MWVRVGWPQQPPRPPNLPVIRERIAIDPKSRIFLHPNYLPPSPSPRASVSPQDNLASPPTTTVPPPATLRSGGIFRRG